MKHKLSCAWFTILLFSFIVSSFTYAEMPLLPGTQEYTSLNAFTYRNYSLEIPECTSDLTVTISDGTGEMDLFLRKGEPFAAESYTDLVAQSDALSDILDSAEERIDLTASATSLIIPGQWYIAPANWNDYTTYFTLSNWLTTGMPMPSKQMPFLTYDPIEKPLNNITPAEAQPISVGDIAWGGGTVTIQVGTCPYTEPVDMYFAIVTTALPDEVYMLTADGTLKPASLVGLAPWKTQVKEAFYEVPFGDIPRSSFPPASYYLYFVVAPVKSTDSFYLWSSFFKISGPPAQDNIKPYLDLVLDDTVIDFGRLDNKRRNLGVGTNLGAIPVYQVPSYSSLNGNLENLCTYIGGGTYLKALPLEPITDVNHIDPDQYPDGMTCVFAIVADVDAEALNFQHILPEPIFGRGNIYTAIPIPGGVPAGTLIDNYETLYAYNSMVSAYANSGLLSTQPHFRGLTAEAPVEPLRDPPQEFPYVIAFTEGGTPDATPIVAGQTLSESPNPVDPSGLQPSGRIFKVIVEAGTWVEGNARGYLWMIPVTNDFWDLRHSSNSGDPALWVNDKRVATLAYVGQTIPIIWEAPDDPDAAQSTHDQRHVNPDVIPAGGTVQLEARVQDAVNPEDTAFAQVAWPVEVEVDEECDIIAHWTESDAETIFYPFEDWGESKSDDPAYSNLIVWGRWNLKQDYAWRVYTSVRSFADASSAQEFYGELKASSDLDRSIIMDDSSIIFSFAEGWRLTGSDSTSAYKLYKLYRDNFVISVSGNTLLNFDSEGIPITTARNEFLTIVNRAQGVIDSKCSFK